MAYSSFQKVYVYDCNYVVITNWDDAVVTGNNGSIVIFLNLRRSRD